MAYCHSTYVENIQIVQTYTARLRSGIILPHSLEKITVKNTAPPLPTVVMSQHYIL